MRYCLTIALSLWCFACSDDASQARGGGGEGPAGGATAGNDSGGEGPAGAGSQGGASQTGGESSEGGASEGGAPATCRGKTLGADTLDRRSFAVRRYPRPE